MNNDNFICSNCGNIVGAGCNFCQRCGKKVVDPMSYSESYEIVKPQTPVMPIQPQVFPEVEPKKKKSKLKIWLPISISVVLVVAIVLVVILGPWADSFNFNFLQKAEKATPKYFLYTKDNELHGYSVDDEESFEITRNFDVEDITDIYYQANWSVQAINDDATLLFYFDNYSEDSDSDSADLYCKKLDADEDDADSVIKIDSDVLSFLITNDGKYVYYKKDGDYNLYRHDLENKEKIASDIKHFCINSDGSRVVYSNNDDDVYLRINDENTLIDRNSSVLKISTDLSTVYYNKDKTVYKKTIDKEKEKLASDVNGIIAINEDDSLYYLKSYDSTLNYADYINNDVDFEGYVDPDDMERPSWYDYYDSDYYYSIEDYDQAEAYYYDAEEKYEAACEEYEEEYNKNYELESYMDFMDELEGEEEEITCHDLYYSKDGKSEKIRENFSYRDESFDNMLFYVYYDRDNMSKIDLTDAYYDGLDYTMEAIHDDFYKESDICYAYKSTTEALNTDRVADYNYDERNNRYYYVAYDSEYDEDIEEYEYKNYELYKIDIKDNKVSSPDLVQKDVIATYIADGFKGIFTIRNTSKNSYCGDLYYNDEIIDYDVAISSLNYDKKSKSLYYYSNYDSEKDLGTLNFYDGKDKTKIADDVNEYISYDTNDIYYTSDISSKTGEGTLYHYDGNEKTVIDQDCVTSLIEFNNNQDVLEYNCDFMYSYYSEY